MYSGHENKRSQLETFQIVFVFLFRWEVLATLLPELQVLNIVFVGPELRHENQSSEVVNLSGRSVDVISWGMRGNLQLIN